MGICFGRSNEPGMYAKLASNWRGCLIIIPTPQMFFVPEGEWTWFSEAMAALLIMICHLLLVVFTTICASRMHLGLTAAMKWTSLWWASGGESNYLGRESHYPMDSWYCKAANPNPPKATSPDLVVMTCIVFELWNIFGFILFVCFDYCTSSSSSESIHKWG